MKSYKLVPIKTLVEGKPRGTSYLNTNEKVYLYYFK